ncbi:porin family protein [Xanthocytophaga agilis]|uniref:Porin family protein n=1 Tax=Xanthocytophaga agilis TaxID=3048010 RepID=A0AAE3R5I1_9BACT|nr:porin family protein [Xanthocytophaga agilis]MDJ1501774.1 porin family protein [Xanthocytophaga agilis]
MKKVFLSIAAVAAMVFTAQAQFKITPKIGYTVSKMSISDLIKDDESDIAFTSGFSAGAAFELGIGDIFSIQPEILYTQKGFKEKYDDGNIDYHINHLEVPILLKETFGEEDNLQFFGYVGPYLGYALGGKLKDKENGMSSTSKIKFKDEPENYSGGDIYISKNEVNRLDIGAYVGAGVSLPVGPGAFSLEARYGYGFTNFRKDPDNSASRKDLKSQNRTIGVFLGYSISLRGN